MKLKITLIALVILGAASLNRAEAQKYGIKTNLVYDATATLNLGVEFPVGQATTIDLSGNFNPFRFPGGRRWKHWLAQPEIRFWTCNRYQGHFFALHALGGMFDVGNIKSLDFRLGDVDFSQLKHARHKGWCAGAGFAYGYAVTLSRYWNMEFEVGVGYAHVRYDKYDTTNYATGYKVRENVHKSYFGPTKLALNLVYLF